MSFYKTYYYYRSKMSKLKCALFIIILTILILFYKYKDVTNTSDVQILQTPKRNKTILYWNDYFSIKDYFGNGFEPFENCDACYITRDRNYLPIEEFDAIIFHGGDAELYTYGKPSKRNPKQRYVFYTMETPLNKLCIGNYSNDFFNWTMTYWKKSDVVEPYGEYVRERTNYELPNEDFVEKKTKMAAWLVSNCKTNNKREEYVKELQKYIDVDIYGSCGTYNCSKNESEKCFKMMENDYYFYLSFENSFCEDYVTEKVFAILKYNIIPIVYGHGNYLEVVPPLSVINTVNYKGPKQLADYMKYLVANPKEYLSYLNWKKDYTIYRRCGSVSVCTLCKKLHRDGVQKTYENLTEWWTGNCLDHSNFNHKFEA